MVSCKDLFSPFCFRPSAALVVFPTSRSGSQHERLSTNERRGKPGEGKRGRTAIKSSTEFAQMFTPPSYSEMGSPEAASAREVALSTWNFDVSLASHEEKKGKSREREACLGVFDDFLLDHFDREPDFGMRFRPVLVKFLV